ncbi:MAG: hypothetical protein KKG70_16600 [Proteobacteria bacterium]|nr:hypothetical protein [Pseudomonadota bacterium]
MVTNESRTNGAILVTTLALLFLADRLILAIIGLPLWMPDMENHYRHRPNTVRSWGEMYDYKLIRTNQYGHHDHDFPLQKSANEFRVLILGDSITMGHGVTREETYANQLEHELAQTPGQYEIIQVINTGVQGYSTFQELNELKRSLKFKPDLVAIGFCMNDVQEPLMINREFGGAGIDYHGVTQAYNLVLAYLLNETGYGRLLQKLRERPEQADWCRGQEIKDVKAMVAKPWDNIDSTKGWDLVLKSLTEIYQIADQNRLKVVLLIFPHTFQLMHPEMQYPQQKLTEHAIQHKIDFIDFTTYFEELTAGNEQLVKRYFLDLDHYTPEGHRLVATRINRYLKKTGQGPWAAESKK